MFQIKVNVGKLTPMTVVQSIQVFFEVEFLVQLFTVSYLLLSLLQTGVWTFCTLTKQKNHEFILS